jgi:hypothetical protein
MGQMTSSFRPPWAVVMWADDNNIYAELPMTNGGPSYVTRYPKSEGGLSAALAVLMQRIPEAPRPSASTPANFTRKPQPMVQTKLTAAQVRLREETTESQRENARKVLAKLGLKP